MVESSKGGLAKRAEEAGGLPIPSGDGWGERETGEKYTFKEVGQVLQGLYVRQESATFDGKVVPVYIIDDGKATQRVLGQTRLDPLMQDIETGREVWIHYCGTLGTKKGYEVNDFRVYDRALGS